MHEDNVLDQHSVPSTAAGFDFQFQRALLELIMADNGVVVGIETLDDVSVISSDGVVTLEQDKFTTGTSGKVYGDKTHNLLNTLSTWLEAAIKGEIDCKKTKFNLVTSAECTTELVHAISNCQSKEDARGIVDQIRNMESKSQDYLSLIKLMKAPNAENILMDIIVSTKLLERQNDITLKVQAALFVENVYASSRHHIYQTLLGWVHDSAFIAWQKKMPCLISKQSFINEFGALKDRLRRSMNRERPPSELPVTQADIAELEDRMFVRQIKLVSDDQDESYEARTDYWRCITEKSRLCAEGEILKQDWLDFDEGLRNRWRQIFRLKNRLHQPGMSEEDIGYDIMNTTLSGQDEVKLAGAPITYPYLAKGSYHRLSDVLEVGWHPRFEDMLR